MLYKFKKYIANFINKRKLYPVRLNEAYDSVRFFHTDLSKKIDITSSQVLISLKGLVIAIHFQENESDFNNSSRIIIERSGGEKIASLTLRYKDVLMISNKKILLFDIIDFNNYKRAFYTRVTDYLLLHIKNILNRKSNPFRVNAKGLNRLFIYYLKPRPVYLVSLKKSESVDIFPIDIMGNIFDSYYFVSIRTTNPSVKKIIETAKICISAVPFDSKKSIYSLGKHHKNGELDLNKIDFKVTGSKLFNIPIPIFAISVIEGEVEKSFIMGGHTVFVVKAIANCQLNDGYQLAHTPWYNLLPENELI